jgi:hypothetical protein
MYEAAELAKHRVEFEVKPGKFTPTFWGTFDECIAFIKDRVDVVKYQHYQIWQGQKLVQLSVSLEV